MHSEKIGIRGALLLAGLLVGGVAAAPVSAGTLEFFAHGEDLATQGFVDPTLTKDGWTLRFDHIFVALSDITAYQTDPPFDAQSGAEMSVSGSVTLPGTHIVDLVDADADDRVLLGQVDAPPGHYNAIGWRMLPVQEAPLDGAVMLFVGTATRGDEQVRFQLVSDEARQYLCGEFVGDERKGFVADGGVADLELTFHLDHIFGRADRAADNPMNREALGFDGFAWGSGKQTIRLEGLHIGHAGEGHCRVIWE